MGYIDIRQACREYIKKEGLLTGLKDIMGILHVIFIDLEQEEEKNGRAEDERASRNVRGNS
jgi:hypothetical protein